MQFAKKFIWLVSVLIFEIVIINTVCAEQYPSEIHAEEPVESISEEVVLGENVALAMVESIPLEDLIEPEIVYEDVDEAVYTLADADIYLDVDSTDPERLVAHSTNLHRTGTSDEWSRIEIDQEVFYVRNDQVALVTDQRLYDIDLLARTIHAEAGNQSEDGQRAVGSVIMNRKDYDGYGGSSTVEGVISFPNQFSSYKNSDWLADYSEEIYRIATEVYDGYTNLPREVRCFKATYCTVKWNLEFYKQIGDHNFYYLP